MLTSCSNPERIWKVLLVSLAGLACGGCFTGHLVESGRLHESLLHYDRATYVGNELVIEYTAKRSGEPPVLDGVTEPNQGQPTTRTRAVAIPRDALASHSPIAVEDFPLRRLPGRRIAAEQSSGRDIPLRRSSPSSSARSSRPAEFIEVEVDGMQENGLRVCEAKYETCGRRFYSETLYQTSLAWWVYPLVPLMVAIDVAVLPIHVITLPILVTTGD